MKNRFFLLILLLSITGTSTGLIAAETIYLYSYHNHPPFVTATQQGRTYKLADYLNQIAQDKYHFEVKILPRARLNHLLVDWISGKCPADDCISNWMVPWVNPKWGFIKGEKNNYQWQKLFDDSNSIISSRENPVDYQNPESLSGKVLLGMRGHRYVGIDDLVQQGNIKRIDGNRERDNLKKILSGRADATLLPTSTIIYMLHNDIEIKKQAEKFHVSDTKHQKFTRYLMLPQSRTDLYQLIKQADLRTWMN